MDKKLSNVFLGLDPKEAGLSQHLAEDIELIDRLLGELLSLENEEEIRTISQALYQHCLSDMTDGRTPVPIGENLKELYEKFPDLKNPKIVGKVLRAFTILFQLVNTAEQKEIVLANRKRQALKESKIVGEEKVVSWRPESIGDAVHRLAEAGVTPEEMQGMIDRMEIVPTLTAHPTEARRRVVMDKLLKFADALNLRSMKADAPLLRSPLDNPVTMADEMLIRQLVALWNTDELRATKVSVMDEVTNSVYFFQHTILDVVAWLHHDLEKALGVAYPGHKFRIGTFLRYHSWVGGDRDGNPNVTPEITWETILYHHQIILNHYLTLMEPLKRELSLSSRIAPACDELRESLMTDAANVAIDRKELDRFRYQPYALKVSYIEQKLRETLDKLEYLKDFRENPLSNLAENCPAAYESSDEFIADLELIDRSLTDKSTIMLTEEGVFQRILVQAKTFGFHLASLDVRQHSKVHGDVLSEIFTATGVVAPGVIYSELSEEDKLKILEKELESPRPLLPRNWKGSAKVQQALEVFEVIQHARKYCGRKSVSNYIISMTHKVSNMLEVLVLGKEVGLVTWQQDAESGKLVLKTDFDVVPLFETIEDLQQCDKLLNDLFANSTFRVHLKGRYNFQEIMLGYSDSSKDGGYLAANWNLQDTQDRLAKACHAANLDFRFFHGRGGTVGRGGGRASRAILSQPKGSFTGRIRFTEQGEVVSFRYSLRPMAHRHLEQIVNSVLLAMYPHPERIFGDKVEVGAATPSPVAGQRSHDEFAPAMEKMAAHSREVYRSLVHEDPEFWDFYTQATPIAHISQLPITSRPAMRSGGKLNGLDELRAIPWVFAWVQSRYVLPGWYGIGAAFKQFTDEAPGNIDSLRAMYSNWPFFRTVINNAQLELSRTHLPTACLYAGRVRPASLGKRFHSTITAEYDLAKEMILKITGQNGLMDNSPVVRSTIKLRNPAVLPLHRLQVMLMELWQELPEEERNSTNPYYEPVLLSLTSIAAGMQSTG